MADDTKYKEIFSMFLIDGRTQLFAIDRDYKLWSMYMTMNLPVAQWTDWTAFPLPGDSGGVMKVTGASGSLQTVVGQGNQYWFPRIWAIDTRNELWTCESTTYPSWGGSTWSAWTPWVAPYPNN
jgi:hypothetical protein